jgi:epidermal growth factor receptor substrate 15
MKRLITALAATVAALTAATGTAFAADPVQSATQSSSTDQAALAASSATQVDPSNQNISVRVLSPGNDGAVSQSNEASSSATAANTASTTQNANQALGTGCGCVMSGSLDDVLAGAMQAAGTDATTPATAAPTTAAPAAAPTTQSNDASSAGTADNAAPTSQTASQSGTGTGGVQSSQQNATTDQNATAASSATQVQPSNSNISVRVLSPGNDGAVTQSNEASSSADATNTAATTQGSSQAGSGSGVQSSTQNADTSQKATGLSSATQVKPENSNLSVRVLSPGDGGSVSQSNEAESSANAQNTAPVTQTATQNDPGSSCGCHSTSPAVQAIGQSSNVDQLAAAASSATQLGASNTSDPIRIASGGNDGSLTQKNEAESSASATNTAPVMQSGSQVQGPSSCGCSSGPAVQALGQSSEIGQLAAGFSSAKQIGATNESGPIRIASWGNGGTVSQSNEAESSASAANNAPTTQSGNQTQAGSGVQALGQQSSIWQGAFAASSALQLPGRSECGCGGSFGNSADPVRIASGGNDGALKQENEASSSANASSVASPTQTATQTQLSSKCGCFIPRVQALGQWVGIDQVAAALSSATQIGASNSSDPIRIWSYGGSGRTEQSNEAESSATAPNLARTLQGGTQFMF